jgi:hypothetical protein
MDQKITYNVQLGTPRHRAHTYWFLASILSCGLAIPFWIFWALISRLSNIGKHQQ